jgi:hypothetical protein
LDEIEDIGALGEHNLAKKDDCHIENGPSLKEGKTVMLLADHVDV